MMKVIGITGRAGAGKDTIADFLVREHGFHKLSFAGPLKAGVRAMFGLTHEQLDLRKRNDKPDNPYNMRRVMQTLGTEWGRQMIHPDLWVHLIATVHVPMALKEGKFKLVFSDVRFDNEARYIEQMQGITIQVVRPAANEGGLHASEAGVSEQYIAARIDNNAYIGQLEQKVRKALMDKDML